MSSWMSGSYIKEWWHLWIKIVAIKYMKTKSSILSKMAHGWNRIWKWNISAAVSDDETSMTKVHCGLHACSTVARDSDWEWKVHRESNTENFQEFQNWTESNSKVHISCTVQLFSEGQISQKDRRVITAEHNTALHSDQTICPLRSKVRDTMRVWISAGTLKEIGAIT